MAKVRQSWANGNHFSPATQADVDFEINTFIVPVGSTLNRTWIDVAFERHDIGTEPPEFVNRSSPQFWGLCYYDDPANNPGTFAEDDDIDWLWREGVTWGPATWGPGLLGGDPHWQQVSVGGTGFRDSKGQRKINASPAFLHWCFDIPTITSDTPIGCGWEITVHALFTVL